MSWQAWVFILLAPIGLLAVAIGVIGRKIYANERPSNASRVAPATVIGLGIIGIATLVLITGVFTIIGTRQIGIATSFGRPTGTTFENGLHWKAPWANVTEMDGSIQYDSYKREGEQDNPVNVRLGNNSIAAADVTIRWEIKQEAAPELFVQYKTFDKVRQNLIERNLQVALNQVFQSFDPFSGRWAAGVPLSSFADDAKTKLNTIVGSQVNILDISIAKLDYDDKTEEVLSRQNNERVNTELAKQQVKTAEETAKAATAKAEQQVLTAEAEKRAAELRAQQPPPNLPAAVADCIRKLSDAQKDPSGCWGQIGGTPLITLPRP